MKKTLRKPEHWQDFEDLCKKLWGEIWKVPNKIKKNGRLGQAQSGVDISAIPKGEINYWGIQCKGKNDYTNAKLTEVEVNAEIENAKKFSPKLDVFIIATTTNKDVAIEEYVRHKDLESRNSEGFEILLYCWEDIVDLIEDNRETFNYYVNEQNFKDNFLFHAYLNDFKNEIIIEPTFYRTIKRYALRNSADVKELSLHKALALHAETMRKMRTSFPNFDNTNSALFEFEVILCNEGNKVVEDWRFNIDFEEGQFSKIQDAVGSGFMGMIDVKYLNKRTFCEDNRIGYRPLDNKPLVQGDNRFFEAWVAPLPQEYELKVFWELIARDYSTKGELKFIVKPEYKDDFQITEVDTQEEVKADEIIDIRTTEYKQVKEDIDLPPFTRRW